MIENDNLITYKFYHNNTLFKYGYINNQQFGIQLKIYYTKTK